jgi:DNA-directed RNA polymerase specialized sigma24 family protein
LARLPEPHRQVVRLRHEAGWTLESIARQLDQSPVAVAALLLEAAGMLQADSAPGRNGEQAPRADADTLSPDADP